MKSAHAKAQVVKQHLFDYIFTFNGGVCSQIDIDNKSSGTESRFGMHS
jgi:hypothetical protein